MPTAAVVEDAEMAEMKALLAEKRRKEAEEAALTEKRDATPSEAMASAAARPEDDFWSCDHHSSRVHDVFLRRAGTCPPICSLMAALFNIP